MKTNRFLTSLLSMVALFSVSFLTSCDDATEDSGNPSLAVSTNAIAFDAEGKAADENNGAVAITSNRDWVVVVPEAASWLTASTVAGNGNGSVTFSMSESEAGRSAQVSIQVLNDWGVALEETVTVTQGEGGSTGGGTGVTGEVIFNETVGSVAAEKIDGKYYPNVSEYTEWNTTGTGASSVSFSGTNTSVRSSGLASSAYEGASGVNNIFFGGAPSSFVVEKITLTSEQTKLKINFGGSRYDYDAKDNTFIPANMVLSVSADGKLWSALSYDVAKIEEESWVYCEANFTLKSAASSLYIKLECSEPSMTRVDDITLSVGEGGKEVDLAAGTTTPDDGGSTNPDDGGSTNPDTSITGDYVFDYETLGTSWLNGKEITLGDIVWYVDGMKNSGDYGNIGFSYFNEVGGSCYNKTAFGTGVKEVIVDHKSGEALSVYAGSAMEPTTKVTPTVDGNIYTYTIPASSPYLYFKNESTAYINLNAIAINFDGDLSDGGTTNPDGGTTTPDDGDTTTPPSTGDGAFTLDNAAMGISGNELSGTAVVGGYNFDYAGLSVDATHGTIYIDVETNGYIASASAIKNLTKLVIEGNGYVKKNLVVSVGTSKDDAVAVESSSADGSDWGSLYEYAIPAGSTYISFTPVAGNTRDASVSSIEFYCDLGTETGGGTTTPDQGDGGTTNPDGGTTNPDQGGSTTPDDGETLTKVITADDLTTADLASIDMSSFSNDNNSSTQDLDTETVFDDFKVAFAGTGSYKARYWLFHEAWQIRAYSGDKMTISSETANITSIEFKFGSKGADAFSFDSGEFASSVWSGSAKSVVGTIGGTSYIESITVKYKKL